MDRSRKKRGISLSHQISHDQSPPHTVVSSNPWQLSFRPSISSASTPKDLKFGFQAKTNVAFSYSIKQTQNHRSACNNDFSFSQTNKTPQNRPSFLKIIPVNREGNNNRSGEHSLKNKYQRTQRLTLVSTPRQISGHHTQKRSNLFMKPNGTNQNRESMRQVYEREECQRVLAQRKRDTSNSGIKYNFDQGQHFPNTSSFSKIQIPQTAKEIRRNSIKTARQGLRPSIKDLESLKELQKRLIQIISG